MSSDLRGQEKENSGDWRRWDGVGDIRARLPHLVDDFYGWFFLGVCLSGYFSFSFLAVECH